MKIIGLTGSIGMGKTASAQIFADEGVAVYDADAAVHELYAKGGAAVAPIRALFPDVIKDAAIDRAALGKAVLGAPDKLKALEAIVHPLVRAAQAEFLRAAKARGCEFVVLDIPLLLENKGEAQVDVVVVVSAPPEIQEARVLARAGMTKEKLEQIRGHQMPDSEKRACADFIIDSSVSLDHAREQVRAILAELKQG